MKKLTPHRLTTRQVQTLGKFTIWQQVSMARDLADKTGQPVVLPNGCKVCPTHRASLAETALMQEHLAKGFTDD